MAKWKNGKTAGGKELTDELVEELADKAEAGYDVEETLRRRGGRPPLGSGPATVESVRLEPELRDALAQWARRDRETTSSVIRKALRSYPRFVRSVRNGPSASWAETRDKPRRNSHNKTAV